MRKINLKAKNLPNNDARQYSGRTPVIIGTVLLLLAAGLYGGVFYLKSNQSKKIATIKSNIQTLKSNLDRNPDYQDLYDFQERLLEADRILKNKVVQINVLNKISEATMNEGVLKNLKITMQNGKSDVALATRVADLDILSKQIKAYGGTDVNGQALLTSSSLKEDGIEANIKFSIENLNKITK